ncbi:MAG: thioredoxin family protein [Proteobacteria bacterium]|nr:thioredoxin family protein [Pseudomonadota bacterium]
MRTLFLLLALTLAGVAGAADARAAEVMKYTPAAMAAAQEAGRPILVAIQAPWCPTCAAQKPILQRIEAEASNQNLRVLLVDFDTQKDVVMKLGATMQSTLIMFQGKKEVARSVGDTNKETIEAMVRRSLV